MRKRLFVVGLVVVVAVALVAVFWLSCAPAPAEQANIRIEAALDGAPWSGAVQYTLAGTEEPITGTSVARTLAAAPGTWTCSYVSGGPAGASFVDVTPSASQTVSEGDTITFTLNFELAPQEASIQVEATLCGEPWQGTVAYTLTRPGETVDGASVADALTVTSGTWTCAYVSGGPGRAYLADITPSPTQALAGGGTVTFTLNFELAQDVGIEFGSWTINGQRVKANDPKTAYNVAWGDIIGARFTQHVGGCQGKMVMVQVQPELSVHFEKGIGSVQLRILNQDAAVVKQPAADRSSIVLSLDGMSVLPDTYHDLVLCTPRLMDADIIWEMEQGSGYTEAVNWLRVAEHPQPVNGPYVLADLRFTGPGPFAFALISSAAADLVYDDDVDPDNNHAQSPPLYIIVSAGP
jgi:hypothetical protein